MEVLELRLLGTVEAVAGGRPVCLDGTKPRTALATLALTPGRTVPDDRLAAMLWGGRPPATASAQLYTYMSRLRRRLGPAVRLLRRPPGYQIDLGATRLDLVEFERLRALGQDRLAAGRHDEAADLLGVALALWRGQALGDVTAFLAESDGVRLEDVRLATVEARVEADLALGRHRELVGELTGLVAEHPLRERLRAQLMTALHRDNRRAEALALYDTGRKLLADQLGIAPGAVLEQAFGAVLRGPAPARVTVSEADRRPAMLPADVRDFAGRAGELSSVAGTGDRFVLTGMAGVGKTALAVHAAHRLTERFPDGQLYVDLGATGDRQEDPAQVLGAFLRALGTEPPAIPPTVGERTQRYRTALADRRVLVVLDDAASGAQVGPLLPGSPGCRVLVTARRMPAVLTGARTVALEPPGAAEATAVLAAIVGADRVAEEPDAARRLGDLCGHLPLAIRAAATRLAARPGRPIAHLVRRLSTAVSVLDALTFAELDVRARLASGFHGLPERLRTALGRLAWLESAEFPVWVAARALGTSPDAAESTLDDLLEAHLVLLAGPDVDGRARYRIHVLVRELARELAGVGPAHPAGAG